MRNWETLLEQRARERAAFDAWPLGPSPRRGRQPSAIGVLAAAAIGMLIVKVVGKTRQAAVETALRLSGEDLVDEYVDRLSALERLGLSPRARELQLRRVFGVDVLKSIRAASPHLAPASAPEGRGVARSDRGPSHG